jgi:peptidyl-prolyl cis-trans isomerase D
MLAQLRNMTRGWVAYVLLFLLTIAFAIWGINDIFTGVGSRDLATVGGRGITPAQLNRELELTLRAQRDRGATLTQQEAIDQGFHLQLLDGMIRRHSVYAFAQKIGVDASNRMVADRIRQIPAVSNPVTGNFDETAYAQFLQQLRYNQNEFEEDIRGDLTRAMLLDAMVVGARVPSSFGAMAFTYEAETRVVSIAEAPASAIGAIPAPTDEQIQQFWQEQQDNLRLPEFRALTLVYARAADFVPRVDIPEARLQEEIEARRAVMTQAERRSFVRITAQNQAQADDIAARLNRGDDAAAIGSALGVPASSAENQTRAEVTDTAVATAVFAMQRGQTRVVRGALSPFVVVRVDAVTAAVAPNMSEIRETSRQALALDGASELLDAAISTFEDARAGGAAIDQAARQAGLAVVIIPAVEAQGRDASGQPIAALEGHEEVLRTAFETQEGEASDFIPVGDADVVVAVTGVTPARVRPIEEVRDDLVRAWSARERATRMRELGERVVAAVSGGQDLNAAARANRFNVVVDSRALDRRTASQIPARGLASQIFAAAPGAAVTDVRADGQAILVAVVEEINRPTIAEHPQEVDALRIQMEESVLSSLGGALQDEIAARISPRRNERLIASTYRATNAEGEEQTQ